MSQLHYAFQDANYLYMVMDYMPGISVCQSVCVCVHLSVCACVHASVYVFVHMCMYICMYVCIYNNYVCFVFVLCTYTRMC